jgi:hypothetical protein
MSLLVPGGRLHAPLYGASARSAGRLSNDVCNSFLISYFRTSPIEQGLKAATRIALLLAPLDSTAREGSLDSDLMAPTTNHSSDLYGRDYYAWVQLQVQALREHRTEDIDWENVAEEIEDLGKREKHSVESQLVRLLEHLLKLHYARGTFAKNNARGWQLSAKDARLVARRLVEQNPSLRPQLTEMLQFAYARGRLAALRKARLPDCAIPESCPWGLDLVMDDSFLPGQSADT